LLLFPGTGTAQEALDAVAANIKDVMNEMETQFERSTGQELAVTVGSTGQLYAQIVNGAPFDILLAADQERPERLEREQLAVSGSRLTYAVGRLTLWSPDADRIQDDGASVLRKGDFRWLAIANPALSPYGSSAIEVLGRLEMEKKLRPRIVMGENIGQTFALVATGNAELGFVALSYVLAPQNEQSGSRWDVPGDMYTPIRQDAVLLNHGAENAAARAFMIFLQSEPARATIVRFGYGAM
jgi:molybdate transport system substrate-binding protein